MGSCCTGSQGQEKNCQIILQTQIQNTIISEYDIKYHKQIQFIQGKIVNQVQACARGYLVRKRYQNLIQKLRKQKMISKEQYNYSNELSFKDTFPFQDPKLTQMTKSQHQQIYQVKKLPKVPDYLSSRINKILLLYTNFKYDTEEDNKFNFPIYQLDDGSIYHGQWKNGHGCGKQYWQNGTFYEGYWAFNMFDGRGRLVHSDGNIYEGEFRNDKASGKGIYYSIEGLKYVGEWENDVQSGQGMEIWHDGTTYSGEYKNGLKNGQGVFKWSDGSMYTGQFVDGNLEGVGQFKWEDGRVYDGYWKNNCMHGNGQFKWPDGRKYEGQYNNGIKEGLGQFEWPDGRLYKGDWQNNKQHGVGIYLGYNGIEKEGEWADGKLVRWNKGKARMSII
ncbi:unnamed protein product (macronuclear) [Paramecium tetraurelia]|uniref:MORN repeat protein n=1 Tax=Paramecium tetraurelia TaxID=5888 RepID=A0CX73_PARTE|nr:uncharacterized protein GSPATT00001594001 [Paramecium tetraurelia]CAK75390.1 unnamed protein product [Paramecium tetraurelia]|eukprot:XP_001442787.1 hypothetical protein (macronuclear) [Paramecium tetraurelia strain d4-2]